MYFKLLELFVIKILLGRSSEFNIKSSNFNLGSLLIALLIMGSLYLNGYFILKLHRITEKLDIVCTNFFEDETSMCIPSILNKQSDETTVPKINEESISKKKKAD